MRMWNGARLKTVQAINANVKSKDDFRINEGSKWDTYIYVENNQEFKTFKENYQNIFTREVDISEKDIVYFFKESKYPRFKFSANCNNPKTISIEKADWIITPQGNINFNTHRCKGIIIQDTLTDNAYVIQFDYHGKYTSYFTSLKNLYQLATEEEAVIRLLQEKFLIQEDNYEIIRDYAKFVVTGTNEIQQFIDNIEKYHERCINEENLERYVSKDSTVMDSEMYESINTMLNSTDGATVELGIKMLSNFSVDKSSARMGILIRANAEKIANNKGASTAGFKNVLKQIGIDNLNNARYQDVLSYMDSLYKNSTDEENKSTIREAAVVEILSQVNNYFISRSNLVSILGIKMNLDIF